MQSCHSIANTLAIVDTALSPNIQQQTPSIDDTPAIVDTALSPKHVYYTTTNSLNSRHTRYSGHCSQSQTCSLQQQTPSISDTLASGGSRGGSLGAAEPPFRT